MFTPQFSQATRRIKIMPTDATCKNMIWTRQIQKQANLNTHGQVRYATFERSRQTKPALDKKKMKTKYWHSKQINNNCSVEFKFQWPSNMWKIWTWIEQSKSELQKETGNPWMLTLIDATLKFKKKNTRPAMKFKQQQSNQKSKNTAYVWTKTN